MWLNCFFFVTTECSVSAKVSVLRFIFVNVLVVVDVYEMLFEFCTVKIDLE